MLRVLHMIGSLNVGGSQSMVLNLYKSIDRSEIQFDFILDHKDELFFKSEVDRLGGKIYFLPRFTGFNYIEVKKAWNRFFVDHPEYRILHSHVRSYASIYLPIAKKYGVKTIIHSHSTSNGKGISSLAKAIMQYPLRKQADYFMSCSREAGKWLFGKKVLESGRCCILPNAIDVNAYRFSQDTREKYRAELGLKDELTFIHVGRFHPAKNHIFLLNLFKEIHNRDQNTKLVLVGDGELRPEIEKHISELCLESSIILTGNRNDVPNLLQAADCFLFPSRWEGLGIVAIEAQAAGLHTICNSELPKEIRITEMCDFVSLNEFEIWVESALKRFQRANTIDQIKKSGYDIDENAKTVEVIYKEIIGEKNIAEIG